MAITRDYGIVEPVVFSKDDRQILFNPYTAKKIFTDRTGQPTIQADVLAELKNGLVVLAEPKVDRYRIEVDFNCDALCDYCLVYNNPIQKLDSRMSLQTAMAITKKFNTEINDNPDLRKGSVMIIGGEPLLNMQVVEYLIKNINGYINIFTNGRRITDETADLLAQPHVATFVSIDGREKENFHRKKKDRTPLYQDSVTGHAKLRDRKARTGISCLVTDDNVDSLTDIVKFFHEELRESVFGLSFPHKTVKNNFNVDISKYSQQIISLLEYSKNSQIFIAQIANILRPLVNNTPRLLACKVAGEQITFYPDGKETLCTKLDTLPEFMSKNASELLEQMPHMSNSCENCSALSICGGGCIWDAALSSTKKDLNTCYVAQTLLEPLLWSMYDEAPKGVIVKPEHVPKHIELLSPR